MIEGYSKNSQVVERFKDCTCLTCDRDIHHLGIMSHRAMHRRKSEDCMIAFSDGRIKGYRFSGIMAPK